MKTSSWDISTFPISVTDYLVFETAEHKFTFKVTDVEGEVATGRTLTLVRVASSDRSTPKLSKMPLVPGVPMMGVVVPEGEFNGSTKETPIDAGRLNRAILAEAIELLTEQVHQGCKLPFGEVLTHLITVGVLPADRELAQKRLSKIVRTHPTIFKPGKAGGWIALIGTGSATEPQAAQQLVLPRTTVIDFGELMQAIEHLLKSGLFGEVRIVNRGGD